MIHVLYIDDEEHNLTSFKAAFRRTFQVFVTTEPSEAVRILEENPIEVVISDQKMPTLSGVEFFELIMPEHPNPVRMLLTGHADIDAVIDAINKGQIYKYISKPWNEAELKRLVEEASELYQFRTAQDTQASDYSKRLYSAQDKLESLILEIKSSTDITTDTKESYIDTINGAISLLQVSD